MKALTGMAYFLTSEITRDTHMNSLKELQEKVEELESDTLFELRI